MVRPGLWPLAALGGGGGGGGGGGVFDLETRIQE